MPKLFEPIYTASSNDPIMISKKGIKVQIPERMVREKIAEGWVLADKNWRPYVPKVHEEVILRTEPRSREELVKEIVSELPNYLEAVEI